MSALHAAPEPARDLNYVRRRWRRVGALGAVALLVGAMFACGACTMFRHPLLNDVSTDLADPPAFTHAATLPAHAGSDLAYPAAFVAPVKRWYPDVRPLEVPRRAAEAFDLALATARAMPRWEVTWSDRDAGLIEAIATTALLRFRDDVVIRVVPGVDGATARVDVRSRSRVGRGDFGANAARIRAFLDALEAALAEAGPMPRAE